MAQEYQIGALWIGGDLSFLEQLCLKSFVDAGHHVKLYTYHGISNAPEGCELVDANEILPQENFLRHARTDSPALHSDVFRYHMLAKNDHMIWADTDAYCRKPFTTKTGHFYGWESENNVNGGVLGFPRDSEALGRLLEFTSDEFVIPPWFSDAEKARLEARKAAGDPVPAGEMVWGVWGPHAITHFIHETGEVKYALPEVALYPVPYGERRIMLRPDADLSQYITDETVSIHFYGRRMRARIVAASNGVPKPNSLIGRLLEKHGIDPLAAPIKSKPAPEGEEEGAKGKTVKGKAVKGKAGKGKAEKGKAGKDVLPVVAGAAAAQVPPAEGPEMVAEALAAIGAGPVATLADLGATAPDLALALHEAQDCDIALIDVDRRGAFPAEPSPHVARYVDFLTSHGVAGDRIRVVSAEKDLRPADVLLNLHMFGDRAGVKWLPPFLARCLHSESLMLTDIRRKSGAFPLLNEHGSCEILSERDREDGHHVTRALFRPAPPDPATADPEWAAMARKLAGDEGFFRENGTHSFLFVPRGDTLVVSFDNLDIVMNKREGRKPWGFDFIADQGWSMLGVMANGWTWYRDPWVSDQFDALAAEGFFKRFKRVVFYGASMGGYAAAAFSGAAPGADVVAISPQSTVDKSVVPWETRYKVVWEADFSGKYGDAAKVSGAARRVILLFDPYEPLDAAHVARFDLPNVLKLRAPLLGHRLGSSLHQMGILNQIILSALDGSLTEADYYRALRARRSFPRYHKELFRRALAHNHPGLARQLGDYVLGRGDNSYIRREMAALRGG